MLNRFIRSAARNLPRRGHDAHDHHHELVMFTNGPPKKAAVAAWMTFMIGTPVAICFSWWYTYVGSKLSQK
ncbi:predicted protein [Naegleria gruberi]|uniref:Predicted protein n=1 Tax=Naegleria gruberi TaxID=5762 RepID=D2V2I3_NAEGR|nr:uncharacterized protein NAEGRDRAFT_30526 [Naegleria gruberi]EFC49064.1 predicted protein [Naegleria gruberi]|eukprot:XP_002681808.1 predicted protein [Naegleria gruberi strain NEG-M]